MKLVSLNCWGGKMYEPLMAFIDEQKSDTDLFCFQEVYSSSDLVTYGATRMNLFQEMQKVLDGFRAFFFPVMKGNDLEGPVDTPTENGLAIFIRETIPVDQFSDDIVYLERYLHTGRYGDHGQNMAHISFTHHGIPYTVFNLHGLCSKTKTDSPARTEQSRIINQVRSRCLGSKHILCGDFNFEHGTQCMAMLEQPDVPALAPMINLITTNHIPTTRNALFPWPDKFADYTLVTPDIVVHDFEVVSNEVSDHLPMVLKFE